MYFRVYAPTGEPFDVPRELADKLILQDGWTQSPASAELVESVVVELPADDAPDSILDAPVLEKTAKAK